MDGPERSSTANRTDIPQDCPPAENDGAIEDYIYTLEESRSYYRDEAPPFVMKTTFRPGPNDHEDGSRPVILVVAELQKLFGDMVTTPSARLYIAPYDSRFCFWTLDIGKMKIIVKATGQGYWPWLGPQKQFSPDKVARSDQASRGNFYSNQVEKRKSLPNQARNTYATPNEDGDDYAQDEGSNPAIAVKERLSKPAGMVSASDSRYWMEPIPHSTSGQKRARIIYSSGSDDDYVPGRGESRPKRHSPQAFREKRDVRPPVRSPTVTSPSNRETPNPMTVPSRPPIITTQSNREPPKSAVRRTSSNNDNNNLPSSKVAAPPFPTPASRLNPEQLANTTLHISLSSNNYGAIPVQLKACPTMDSFFKTAVNAWELGDRVSQVAAMSVTFKWLPEEEPMVLTRTVPTSFESMLDVIDEAPVWLGTEKKKCDVRVKIIMRG